MVEAESFVDATSARGFDFYSGVPCSYLTPFINYVINSDQLRYVGAANEGDAVAIAAGAELGGRRCVVMFQNSGLGNAVSPLTSLNYIFRLPVLIYVTLRGEPGGRPDEPQHELMGAITTDMLDSMRIPWRYFPTREDEIGAVLDAAVEHMDAERRPFALVMRHGTVAPHELTRQPEPRPVSAAAAARRAPMCRRADVLRDIQAGLSDNDVVITTTGFTGRELYAIGDRPNQLYMVGSMGCASSFGLGLALARPDLRVFVIDGDGAALMRLGAMACVGYERPANLVHVLLDNQVHESTGAQSTLAHSIDFCAIAQACGYPVVEEIADPQQLVTSIEANRRALAFYHVPIERGVDAQLPRPAITPAAVASRLRHFIGECQ
ncbi:MAG TPA: phosphonopyruvate decarboxylase [Gammaproteobacteria bacterium]|nr:phosphonopyruvate decarboxylase [Gammaproteobacteria bacterium]